MTAPQLKVDRSASLDPEAFVFERAEWEFRGDSDENVQMQAKPGSWCKPPDFTKKLGIFAHALVCCPSCHGISALAKSVTLIDSLGKLTPDFACTHPADIGVARLCGFRRISYLDLWLDRPLYAMSYWEGKSIRHKYTHAKDVGEAVIQIGARREKVIAIARAIGFFVNDTKGEKLSTD